MIGNDAGSTARGPVAGTGPGNGPGTGSAAATSAAPGGGNGAPSVPGPATVSGDITSLNPVDGLFLRADHLKAIQTYARELSLAVGTGTGSGVVYGFDVTLDAAKPALNVLPGLAISPIGQPLRSTTAAVVSLAADDVDDIGADGFWVIDVNHAWWNFGSESVFGNLCDEPCSGSSALQPWTAEGVTISLRPDAMPGLSGVDPALRRNWLASQYFERERRQGNPWLVPGNNPAVASIRSRPWTKAIGRPLASTVPIGVIQHIAATDSWLLDVWTARRDIGQPPADNAWRARLAMRPWNVFLAQVLQFEDQLSSVAEAAQQGDAGEAAEALDDAVKTFITQVGHTPVARTKAFKDLVSKQREAVAPRAAAPTGQSLRQMGFDELPSAGFLVRTRSGADMAPWLGTLFGDGVNLQICHVRADHAVAAAEHAQHLDRIPLDSDFGKVDVDILVPDKLADLKGLHTEDYGWVAFVRRREEPCTEPPEPPVPDAVEVYTFKGSIEGAETAFKAGRADKVGPLEYPAGSWEYPGGDTARKITAGPNMAILAVASADERQPLAALRATLFAASLDGGVDPPPVKSTTVSGPEAIVVVTTAPAPAASDKVDVYLVVGDVNTLTEAFTKGPLPPNTSPLGQLEYPAGSWEYPRDDLALKVSAGVGADAKILAIASNDARRPLAALRATLFAACFDKELPPLRVSSVTDSKAVTNESIVFIQPQHIG